MWPGQDPSKTKPRLWQSAADARKVIGEAFIRDGERYQLERARLKIDLDELWSACSLERRTRMRPRNSACSKMHSICSAESRSQEPRLPVG